MERYVFRPYDPIFPKLFDEEKARLETFLGKEALVEHVGSTAVPGLGGKGFSDIAIAVDQDKLSDASTNLVEAGYEYRPDASTKDRWFHRLELPDQKEGYRRYHIHLTYPSSQDWKEMLAFRDYLRSYPDALEKYAEIKKHAAEISNEEREVYIKTKEPVILDIIKKATSVD